MVPEHSIGQSTSSVPITLSVSEALNISMLAHSTFPLPLNVVFQLLDKSRLSLSMLSAALTEKSASIFIVTLPAM